MDPYADTIVLGRTNYEGFYSVWPDITRDENTDARTRELCRWLDATEKVVVLHTLTEAPWQNSRIARDLATEVETLRSKPGRDVLVANSASVIGELLRLDLLDDLRLFVVPVVVGGGLRLFPDGVDARLGTGIARSAACVRTRDSEVLPARIEDAKIRQPPWPRL